MKGRIAIVLCAALCIAGCGDRNPVKPAPLTLLDTAVLVQVRAATARVTAAKAELRLTAYLWRDFMPVSPPDGKPLAAALSITTADSSAFPADLRADAAWVLNGADVWATWVSETAGRAPGDPTLHVLVNGGPKWDPGTLVDVVVRLRDGSGAAWYLGVKRQTIQRTD